jgi:Ca-activated chloride channel homolog
MRIAAAFLFVHIILAPTVLNAALPALRVQGDDGNVALALTALNVRVTVRGHLARTEFELTYRNEMDRDTEGEFEFPLPADAEVSDVGLYFDGVLRRAVAVERVLARTAYDEIMHAGVDPALVEWNAGRSFKLRVYPIPAKDEKKVFIAYDQELTSSDYELDVSYGRALKRFELDVDAEGREQLVNGMVRISRPRSEIALTARSSVDNQWYAAAAIDVDAPRAEMPRAPHVVILYDTSSSSVQQDASALNRFLESFLARQTAQTTADIIPFHVAVEAPYRTGGAYDIARALSTFHALGATNLNAVAAELPRIVAAQPLNARIILVTDGLTSLGDSREVAAAFARLAGLRRPLMIVNAAPSADAQLLSTTANATGGWWIDLTQTDPEIAAASAMRTPARVKLPEPLLPRTITSIGDGRFAIAARSGQALTTIRELPLRELSDAKSASMIRSAFARAQLRELMARNAPDEELIAHGRAFNQLTPRTSLIVLETWQDYLRYGIPLPPDLEAEKEKLMAQRGGSSKVIPGGWFLTGRVLDPSGAPLPGVTVTLLDNGAPLVTDVSGADGWYVLGAAAAPQKPGIRAELAGSSPSLQQWPEPVPSGATFDVTMRLATVSEAITVTASAPTVDAPDANTSAPPALRTKLVTSDELLNAIANGRPPAGDLDEYEMRAAVAKQRRELTRAVIERLRGLGSTNDRVRYYLSARALLGGDKGFHVFAAEVFRDKSPELAARVLSDLAEARPDDAPLLRILARVLDGWGESNLARLLLQRAIEISPMEPQSWREMVLVEARRGAAASVQSWAKRMFAVKRNGWSSDEIYEQTAEALQRWERAGMFERARGVDLRAGRGNDITIELMFDSGWCYVDLHVVEPSGEHVTWNQTTSKAGATFTGGYTFGYGPEIYTLRKAPKGTYQLSLDYWSVDETGVSLEALVHVIVYARGERREHFVVLNFEDEDRPLPAVVIE